MTDHDPYHHLLSNHNCFAPWDFSRPNITHVSYQTKTLCHVGDWYRQYGKPVMVCPIQYPIDLPEEHTYYVKVIDTWEKTQNIFLNGVNGRVMVPLCGKPYVLIAAFAKED